MIVVSPLDALMKDQEHSLREGGVKAIKVCVDDARMEDVKKGCYDLFVSSELLLTSSEWTDMLQSAVYKEQLVGVVVDEAHRVKKWSVAFKFYNKSAYCIMMICNAFALRGRNFRSEFLHLGEVRSLVSSDHGSDRYCHQTKPTRHMPYAGHDKTRGCAQQTKHNL